MFIKHINTMLSILHEFHLILQSHTLGNNIISIFQIWEKVPERTNDLLKSHSCQMAQLTCYPRQSVSKTLLPGCSLGCTDLEELTLITPIQSPLVEAPPDYCIFPCLSDVFLP